MTAKLRLRSSWHKQVCVLKEHGSPRSATGGFQGATFHGDEIVTPENEIGEEGGLGRECNHFMAGILER